MWEVSVAAAAEEEGWNAESGILAIDYLQDICGFTIIEVPDLETAEEIATAYRGKAKYAVQDAAWKILRLGGKYAEAKRRQIDSLCKSGALSFCLDGDEMTVTFSEDGFDYQTPVLTNKTTYYILCYIHENRFAMSLIDAISRA